MSGGFKVTMRVKFMSGIIPESCCRYGPSCNLWRPRMYYFSYRFFTSADFCNTGSWGRWWRTYPDLENELMILWAKAGSQEAFHVTVYTTFCKCSLLDCLMKVAFVLQKQEIRGHLFRKSYNLFLSSFEFVWNQGRTLCGSFKREHYVMLHWGADISRARLTWTSPGS